MEFISTKNLDNKNAPQGQVLVQYLEPFFGGWSVEYAIGYYENPDDYDSADKNDAGWHHWATDNQINVLAYCILPDSMKATEKISQSEFKEKYGSFHHNLGNIGI